MRTRSRARTRARTGPSRRPARAQAVLLTVAADARILAVDDAAVELLAMPVDRLTGRRLWDVIAVTDADHGGRGLLRRHPELASLAGRTLTVELTPAAGPLLAADLTVTALHGGRDAFAARISTARTSGAESRNEVAVTTALGELDGHVVALADARGVITRAHGTGAVDEDALAEAAAPAILGRTANRVVEHDGGATELRAGPVRNASGAISGAIVIGTDVSALRAAQRRLAEREGSDEVTGLPKRAELEERLADTLAGGADSTAAVACFGLDDLGLVNEGLGHASGDALLRAAAERLSALDDSEMVVRLASDRFAVLLPRGAAQSKGDARETAARMLATFARRVTVDGVEIHSSTCAGVAVAPADGVTPSALLAAAESALQAAKAHGPGTVALPRGDCDSARRQLRLSTLLRDAIDRDELELSYQPIFWLDGAVPYGVEALLRWHSAELGTVSPAEFIPVAERTGLIHDLGQWVVGELARQAQLWAARGVFVQIHWNVSVLELLRRDFAEEVLRVLSASGLPIKRFTLEVTESVAVSEPERILPVLQELHRAGLQVAIDDFGAGHSSLSRLREIPAQVLKIDRALIGALPADPRAAAIVTSALGLAEALGMKAVAEGIETDGQREFLAQRACPLVQGYRYARPRPA